MFCRKSARSCRYTQCTLLTQENIQSIFGLEDPERENVPLKSIRARAHCWKIVLKPPTSHWIWLRAHMHFTRDSRIYTERERGASDRENTLPRAQGMILPAQKKTVSRCMSLPGAGMLYTPRCTNAHNDMKTSIIYETCVAMWCAAQKGFRFSSLWRRNFNKRGIWLACWRLMQTEANAEKLKRLPISCSSLLLRN